MKIAVQFGAGAIGRGLLGDLLGASGYHTVFVDTNQQLVDQINEDKGFPLLDIETDEIRMVEQCSALNVLTQEDEVVDVISSASIITTSVMASNLIRIAPTIGKGILKRNQTENGKVDILAFENVHMASDKLKEFVLETTPELTEIVLDANASFSNTVTDRAVMNKEIDGKSVIMIGGKYEASIAQDQLSDPTSKPIKNGQYTDKIGLFVDRKFFVVNGGHCMAAYFGHIKGYEFMWQSFEDNDVFKSVESAMKEIGYMLCKKHNIETAEMDDYIDFVMQRYLDTAKVNGDEIKRVGRNVIQKVSDTDRLILPAHQIIDYGMPFDYLSKGIAAAYHYNNPEDPQAVELREAIDEMGIEQAIEKYSNLKPETALYDAILNNYKALKRG